MPEPPAGGMEPEVRKKCFQAALLPDFNIRDGGRREGRAAQSTETGSRENRASSTLALNVNDNTKQGPGLCDLYKWKWSPRPAQALAQGRLPKGLAMHKVLKKRRPPLAGGGVQGCRQTPGPAASSHEPEPVVTEPRVQIALWHRPVCGREQVPSPR